MEMVVNDADQDELNEFVGQKVAQKMASWWRQECFGEFPSGFEIKNLDKYYTPFGFSDRASLLIIVPVFDMVEKKTRIAIRKVQILKAKYERILSQLLEKNLNPSIRTELCAFGKKCKMEDCQFAHSIKDLNPILVPYSFKIKKCCNFAMPWGCAYGNRCSFVHNISFLNYEKTLYDVQDISEIVFGSSVAHRQIRASSSTSSTFFSYGTPTTDVVADTLVVTPTADLLADDAPEVAPADAPADVLTNTLPPEDAATLISLLVAQYYNNNSDFLGFNHYIPESIWNEI